MSQQKVPHDLHAEAAVLGSCMLDQAALDPVLDIVRADDFFKVGHQIIFRAIKELHDAAEAVDLVTVQGWLSGHGLSEAAGGPVELAHITAQVASASNVEAYIRVVLEKSDARKLQALGQKLSNEALSRSYNLAQVMDESAEALHTIGNRGDEIALEENLGDMSAEDEERYTDLVNGRQRGFTYGPWNLCSTLGPIVPGRMLVLAGRPGEGKSALLLHIGLELARRGVPVLMLSLEMNLQEIKARAAAWYAECDATKLIEGPLTKSELDHAKQVWAQMRQWPFRASFVPGITSQRIRSRIRTSIRKHGTKVVLVDYLQLIQPNGKVETKEQQIAQASESMRLIAQTLGPAMVCAAQLNRDSEKGDKREPRISDLRGSGQIEQDAHIIGLIHSTDSDSIAEAEPTVNVTCAKRRMGSTGRASMKFIKRRSLFVKETASDSED